MVFIPLMNQKYILKTKGFIAICELIKRPTKFTARLKILQKRYHGEENVFYDGDDYAVDFRDKSVQLELTKLENL